MLSYVSQGMQHKLLIQNITSPTTNHHDLHTNNEQIPLQALFYQNTTYTDQGTHLTRNLQNTMHDPRAIQRITTVVPP